VVYGGNSQIDTLDFGPGGWLDFHHGRLDVTGGLISESDADITIQGAGQLWTEGSSGAGTVDIDVDGGRFANTGEMANASLSASDGQVILATGGAEFDVAAGARLELLAEDARMGFDGEDGGIAILDLHEDSTLAFAAEDGDFGTIAEFRSGAFGDAPNVQSGIDLGGSTLEIDLSGLDASSGSVFTLMDSDELVGQFENATIMGLGGRDATIVVDYATDSVRLELTNGSGQVSMQTVGEQSDVSSGETALWAALTADQGVASDTMSSMPSPDEDEEDMLALAG
jgi:hypothetical protein